MENLSRKEFITKTAVIGVVAATTGVASALTSCSGVADDDKTKYVPLSKAGEYYVSDLVDSKAPDGKELKVGIIGCGSRGGGACYNFMSSANGVSIVAMADIFPDRLENLRARLKKDLDVNVADNKIYYGFDSYKTLIDDNPDIDLVIIATPTVFHPEHARYAIEKGKHVFCEKPSAVDPTGARLMMAAAKMAHSNGLCVVTGTQRHHDRAYVESYKKIREGYIGKIVSGNVYWNQGGPWFKVRKKEWTDMEYMLRDFFSWNWLCGDHVLDQMIHNLDVFCWFSHLKPISVVGMGSRLQRSTGDIFDNFSLDYVFEGGIHVHAMARQIDDCANKVGEFIQGTLGSWSSETMEIKDLDGNVVWAYDREAQKKFPQNDPYVLEHANLVKHIRAGVPICTIDGTVVSSLACIMGRESAYTGKEYTWDEILTSELNLMPEKLHLGNTDMSKYKVPKAGKTNDIV
ncbi:MAG: Gfo/Idh/MocA family oxidoreductase [Rikenellaceae bacterium]